MFDPDTGVTCTDFHEISLDIRPVDAHVDGKGDLRVTWPDLAATVCYPAQWLRNHAYSPEARDVRESVLPAPKPWPFRSMEDAPVFDYDTLMQRPEVELECLRAFRTYGMAFIRSAPAAAGVVETLTTRLGYLREAAFGRVRNVRVDPTHDSVTFSSRAVKPHIDASNYIWPIEVQFLHCIANDAVGGDSWIVDGAAVAEQLKQENPAAYRTLARVGRASFPLPSRGRFDRWRTRRFLITIPRCNAPRWSWNVCAHSGPMAWRSYDPPLRLPASSKP